MQYHNLAAYIAPSDALSPLVKLTHSLSFSICLDSIFNQAELRQALHPYLFLTQVQGQNRRPLQLSLDIA